MKRKGQTSGQRGISRRAFVVSTVVAGAVVAGGMWRVRAAQAGDSQATIPQRPLGNTGVKVSAIGLGGYHIGNLADEAACTRHVRAAIDRGITFMDNCWDYHDGKSEIWMGKALQDGYRDKVFLMTKIDGQTREAAAKQIDESLSRLKTTHIDLMQFHEIIRPEDPDNIFSRGGMEALLEAKKAGKVRFIGFTGHKDPSMHLKMLDAAATHKVRIDAVQMPLNIMDAHFRSFEKEVLPRLVKEKIGVLGMKSLGSGHVLKSQAATALECLQYALNLPTSVVITGIVNERDLNQAVEAATTYQQLDKAAIAALLEKTKPLADAGQFEPFKTTTGFDGTARNPQWLGLS